MLPSTFLKLCIIMVSSLMVVCCILSTTGHEWVKLSKIINGKRSDVITDGLWEECQMVVKYHYTCRDVKQQPEWLGRVGAWIDTVRAFMILSIISSVLTIGWMILCLLWKKHMLCYSATLVTSFLTGLFLLSAVVVFHIDNGWTNRNTTTFEFGWSFDIAIVGIVNAFLIGLTVLFAIHAERKENERKNSNKQEIQNVA